MLTLFLSEILKYKIIISQMPKCYLTTQRTFNSVANLEMNLTIILGQYMNQSCA